MNPIGAAERRFVAAFERPLDGSQDPAPALQRLAGWQRLVAKALASTLPEPMGLQAGSALAGQIQALNARAHALPDAWQRQWAARQPAQAVADLLGDQLMLLVFGKFNAGKSALCNFLGERLAAQGWQARYFHLEGGRIVDADAPFVEGATETTARLQGVVLGERLVLLDTPGLHSVTADNAALTQRFIDSADAVLWLTSSTAPGQVQELDALAQELRRSKPLLPVLTRSDVIEEDEVDGALCRQLRNKTVDNRALQERDVAERTRGKLAQLGVEVALLRPAVSVSVHMAREGGQSPQALQAAGFERLFQALGALAGPALAYRQRKPAEILLHHLQEDVLQTLQQELGVLLNGLQGALREEQHRLQGIPVALAQATWRTVMPQLSGWIDAQFAQGAADPAGAANGVQALCQRVGAALSDALQQQARVLLSGYSPGLVQPLTVALPVAFQQSQHPGWTDGDGPQRLYVALSEAIQLRLTDAAWLTEIVAPCSAVIADLLAACERLQATLQELALQLDAQADALRDAGAADARSAAADGPMPVAPESAIS